RRRCPTSPLGPRQEDCGGRSPAAGPRPGSASAKPFQHTGSSCETPDSFSREPPASIAYALSGGSRLNGDSCQARLLSDFKAITLMTSVAGLAGYIFFSPVRGSVPIRSGRAGRSLRFTFNRLVGTTNSPGPDLATSRLIRLKRASKTSATFFLDSSVLSAS